MAEPNQIAWVDLVGYLSADKKSAIRALDTVFIDKSNGHIQWYFTNKSGSISKKKESSTSLDSILDRFSRFSLSNPCNTEGIIGVLVDLPVGFRKLMKKGALETYLKSGMPDLDKSGAFLQVYLRPLRGADVLFSCESNRLDEQKYNHEIIVVHQHHDSGAPAPTGRHEVTEDIYNQVTSFSESIIKCLRSVHNVLVDQMTIECIVDDNQQAWLSSVSQCEISPRDGSEADIDELPRENQATAYVINDESKHVSQSNVLSPNARNNSSGITSEQQQQSNIQQQQHEQQNQQQTQQHKQQQPVSKASIKKDIADRKKAKKELKTGDSGFKRSAVDMPPSIELIAKFAAEKERLLHQEEDEMFDSRGTGGLKKKGKTKEKAMKRSNSGNAAHHNGAHTAGANFPAPLDPINHLDMTERHIEELQKRASAAATVKSIVQQQQQQQLYPQGSAGMGLPGSRQPLGSSATGRPGTHLSSVPNTRQAMSGSEAEFLVRQIHSATDLSQLSMFSNVDEFETVNAGLDGGRSMTGVMNGAGDGMGGLVAGGESIWSTDGPIGDYNLKNNSSVYGGKTNSMADVMTDALKDKLSALERQIVQLNNSLARKEAELEKKDAKLKKLASDVDIARRDAQMDIRRLLAEHELEILKLKEAHSKEKAALLLGNDVTPSSSNSPEEMSHASAGIQERSSPLKHSASVGGSAHEANSKLIEQVELLRQENRRLQESVADERRSLMIEHSNRYLAQERALKAEIMELRSMHAGYEDKLTQSAEELSAATAKIHALQGMNQQLEIAKKNALDAQTKLRGDLKNMQQSVQASYRLETTQGIGAGGGADADTAIRLADAKNEAKTRQLMNKLEFLKAQLDAEKKSADDARTALQMMQGKLDDLREEHKSRMLQAESDQRYAVEMAEQQLDAQYQERMKELTTLQVKFLSVQGQLSEAQEQEIMAKQREDHAKSVAAKSNALQAALKTELEQLRSQVASLREERENELLKESGKQSQDAVIRRLDNERQYLKSQLSSEVTHKSELQAALTQCQQQLGEVQKQWKCDVDTLKDQATYAAQQFSDKELKYLQLQAQLDSDLRRSQTQTKELKEGFVKLRDQVRMEQLALENANTQHRRLQEAFDEAQAEVVRLKQQEQQNAALHKAQVEAMNESIAEQEKRTATALQKLKDELSGQFMDNAHAQTVMMQMKDEFAEEKLKLTQISGVVKLAEVLRRWKRCRVFSGFRRWHTNSSLTGAAKQFREQVETILKKTSKEMHRDKLQALENQRNDLNAKHSELLSSKQSEWEDALNDAMRQADETKQRELDNQADEFRAQLQQAESDFMFDLQAARKEGEEEIARAIKRKDEEIAQLHKSFQVDMELAREDAMKQQEDALIVKEQEMIEIMNQNLQKQEQDLSKKHAKHIEKLAVEHDFQLHTKENLWKSDLEKLKLKLTTEQEITVKSLNETHKKSLAELATQNENEKTALRTKLEEERERAMSLLRAEMHTAAEIRVRELRAVWQEEFDARSAQLRGECDSLLATKMEEYGKAMESEKQRAVKLEGSKWKQALKDASQSHELQSMKTKAEVANEKDREMRVELQRMSDTFEKKRAEDLVEHQANLESVRRDHAVALERNTNAHNAALERLRLELEISLKEKHDALWTEKMALEMGGQKLNYEKKLEKERERFDQLKHDFTQQSHTFALERSSMQRQIDNADERLLQVEATYKSDTADLKRAHEDERRSWEEQRVRDVEKMEEEFAVTLQKGKSEVEKQCMARAQKQLQEESARMNEEMDRQVSQMQEESEKLISGLEQAMGNLKSEKSALATELENMSNKLEETEDCLYDLRQECKRVKMDSSLAVWKSVTKIFQMRQRFQEGIAQFDQEATKRYAEIKREMQEQLDHSTLTVMKLASILQDSDAARIGSHTLLTTHRTTELIASRNKIQVMEQDLERLTMEKDSLEEQKELMDGDIRMMEGQVRELEDLIRSHNQESSMINGRINVAHARKKRRLDSDLEQLLESIEHKRHTMSQMDRRITDKAHERDDLEMELIDIERKLVEILLEQQKLVLSRFDEGKLLIDKVKVVMGVAKVQFPVPAEPTIEYVQQQAAALRARLKSHEDD